MDDHGPYLGGGFRHMVTYPRYYTGSFSTRIFSLWEKILKFQKVSQICVDLKLGEGGSREGRQPHILMRTLYMCEESIIIK